MLASCQNETEELSETHKVMGIDVSIQTEQTRAMFKNTGFAEGAEIGLLVVAADESKYDNQTYHNVKATSVGTNGSQTWTTASQILLSSTIGKAAAYYPYSNSPYLPGVSVDGISGVCTDGQTDYMYSGWVENLSSANPQATFTMKHGLAAVKIVLKKQYYTQSGKTTSITVQSPGFGKEGKLHIGTGALSDITRIEAITRSVDFTLDETGKETEILVVPVASATDNDLTVSATIDGNHYSVTIPMTAPYEQGKIFSYTLTLKGTELVVSSASIETWTPVEKTSIDILPA